MKDARISVCIRGLTDDLVSHILLRALRLSSQERGNCSTSQGTTNLTRTRRTQLLNDGGVLLTETTGVEEDGTVVPFEPSVAAQCRIRDGENSDDGETQFRFCEHFF